MNAIHTIIGMPDSGKTTFLAALWHLVTSGESQPVLQFDRLDGDVQYLNAIAERWQRCEKAMRTSQAEDHRIIMYLKDRVTSVPVVLNFTDLSGERFESQFATRTCSAEYLANVNGDGGLLLFVNADRAHEALTISDANGLVEGASAEIDVEWKPEFVSEQAQLVDLLQCLQQRPFVIKRRRLALIVSAWDVVKHCATAEEWVRLEMPFLDQFLATNGASFDIQMYGVSAQGGVLEGTARDQLLRRTPSDRIRCIGQGTDSSDISLPLQWLTGLSNE